MRVVDDAEPLSGSAHAVDRELRVDHVLVAVDDLAEAAGALEDRYGLASLTGGRHPQWGTANRIVPIGDTYLELVAVVDSDQAQTSAFGRWVASASPSIMSLLGWAVRTDAIDDVARRLHLEIEPGSRAAPDGRVLEWKLAGVQEAAIDPARPFFIQWGVQTPHPSHMQVTHRAGVVELARIELRGGADRLAEWLGEHALPLTITHGPPELSRIVLTVDGREVALGAETG